MTVTISGVNDVPEVSVVSSTVDEDAASYTLDLLNLSAATDVDGDTITYVASSATLISGGDAGGVSISADGTATVDPSYYNYLAIGESVLGGLPSALRNPQLM